MVQWAAETMNFSLRKGSTAQSRSLQSLERLVMASARDEDITRAKFQKTRLFDHELALFQAVPVLVAEARQTEVNSRESIHHEKQAK